MRNILRQLETATLYEERNSALEFLESRTQQEWNNVHINLEAELIDCYEYNSELLLLTTEILLNRGETL